MPQKYINVMISSRCNDPFPPDQSEITLSDIRKEIKEELEGLELLTDEFVKVWINEDASPEEGSTDSWDTCLQQVKRADILICLYNGNAGWAKEDSEIGICHAELQEALTTAPAKVRLIKLKESPELDKNPRNVLFQKYVTTMGLFRGAEVNTVKDLEQTIKRTLLTAIIDMVKLGTREAKKGKFYLGEALEWSKLDFSERKKLMESTVRRALLMRGQTREIDSNVFVSVAGMYLLFVCHSVPAAFSISAAREMIGKPFLKDYEYAPLIEEGQGGPIHIIACHKNITENQAMSLLGFPDATIIQTPFGIYVADGIQKIQIIFLANCRDESTTLHGIQRFFEWLNQSGEGQLLSSRASSRRKIIKTIYNELMSD